MQDTEAAKILRSGRVTSLSEALTLAQAHYAEIAVDSDGRTMAACEDQIAEIDAIRAAINSLLSAMRRTGISKRERRRGLIAALSINYSEWGDALREGNYATVIS